MERELLKGNTPTLILAVLHEGPQHGYAIAHEIGRRSGDLLKFRHGTLYPALHALELEGHIVGDWEYGDTDRPRKVYRLTASGSAELERRAKTWATFSGAVNNILGGRINEQPV